MSKRAVQTRTVEDVHGLMQFLMGVGLETNRDNSTIYVRMENTDAITATLIEETLDDGSTVYDVVIAGVDK